jgi:hypothetical protein
LHGVQDAFLDFLPWDREPVVAGSTPASTKTSEMIAGVDNETCAASSALR